MLFEFNLSSFKLRNGINKMNKEYEQNSNSEVFEKKKNGMAGAEERL